VWLGIGSVLRILVIQKKKVWWKASGEKKAHLDFIVYRLALKKLEQGSIWHK